jgi:hypothetical protein
LNAEQRLELTREFAQGLADRHRTAVDFAIHAPHGETDGRNFHAHLMMTTRAVNSEGLGDKTAIERENKWLAANNLPLTQVQLVEIRQSWEQTANEHLARAGLEIQIDHRSHMERGLEIEPTEHMGVHATQMQRRGQEVSRTRLDSEAARRNAELIREKRRVNSPITLFVGVRQRRTAHGTAKAHVIELGRLRIQTDFEVAEAFSIGQLRKRHGAKLLGAGERAHTIVAIVTIHNAMKCLPRQKIHELSKESFVCVH